MRMRFDGAAPSEPYEESCPFCDHASLDVILDETERFFLLADNAPLVEGHMLIVPREHHTCYGAIPAEHEDEWLALKARVARFCAEVYRPPIFFEHGVFGQSVFHAHLHVVPLGPSGLRLHQLAAPDGRPVASPADVRHWYEANGHYFFLESPTDGAPGATTPTEAAVFPPHEGPYVRVLTMLRQRSNLYTPWQPQFARRAMGAPKMRALEEKWHAFSGRGDTLAGER